MTVKLNKNRKKIEFYLTRKRKYDIVGSLATVSEGPRRKLREEVLKKKKGREEKTSSFFRKTNSQHKESVTVEKKNSTKTR